MLKRYRDYDYQLLALIPQKSSGGKGKTRITFITEKIIKEIVDEYYFLQHRTQISPLVKQIASSCVNAGVKPPSEQTIRRRIAVMRQKRIVEYNRASHASSDYTSVQGFTPETQYPHDVWQIDHTQV